MRDGVRLLSVSDGMAEVKIDCSPNLPPDDVDRFTRGIVRARELLMQVDGVVIVYGCNGKVAVDMQVPDVATARELHRLADIFTIVVTDAMNWAVAHSEAVQ